MKIKSKKIIAGTANAKFESLKIKLISFSFNSLNVLSSIEENPENAQRFTTSFKFIAMFFRTKTKELVSVEENWQNVYEFIENAF
jgi:hypothetical protein